MVARRRQPRAAPLPPDRRRDVVRALGTAQLEEWGPIVLAWTHWSYTMLIDTPPSDVRELGKPIELGLFPTEVRS